MSSPPLPMSGPSQDHLDELGSPPPTFKDLGRFRMKGLKTDEQLVQLLPYSLRERSAFTMPV